MATLSRADVEHVAHLARLGLTADELALLEGQLNHILDQYAILATVPTDHIAPTAQTIELENILRDDVAQESLPVEGMGRIGLRRGQSGVRGVGIGQRPLAIDRQPRVERAVVPFGRHEMRLGQLVR